MFFVDLEDESAEPPETITPYWRLNQGLKTANIETWILGESILTRMPLPPMRERHLLSRIPHSNVQLRLHFSVPLQIR